MSWENSTSRLHSDIYLWIINEPEYWMTLAVIDFALSAVTAFANSILLVTIWYNPLRLLRTPPGLLMATLSSADLLVGLCVIPIVALRDVYRSLQQVAPLPSIVGTMASCIQGATLFGSSATIVAMSTACFYAINNPFRYKTNMTRKRVYWLIIMIWIVSVLICSLPVINIPEKTYMLIYTHTHISLPALLLVIIFVKGFRSLSRRRQELLRSTNTSARNHKLALERKHGRGCDDNPNDVLHLLLKFKSIPLHSSPLCIANEFAVILQCSLRRIKGQRPGQHYSSSCSSVETAWVNFVNE